MSDRRCSAWSWKSADPSQHHSCIPQPGSDLWPALRPLFLQAPRPKPASPCKSLHLLAPQGSSLSIMSVCLLSSPWTGFLPCSPLPWVVLSTPHGFQNHSEMWEMRTHLSPSRWQTPFLTVTIWTSVYSVTFSSRKPSLPAGGILPCIPSPPPGAHCSPVIFLHPLPGLPEGRDPVCPPAPRAQNVGCMNWNVWGAQFSPGSSARLGREAPRLLS